jgi:transposase
MEEVDDVDLVVERIAALDLGKAGLEACVRVPHPQKPGRRMQELRGYGTTTAQLLEMVGWLRHWRVQRVVMESTSTYWKGVYYLLEAEGFECWLVNAREVKNVPGRAKTDRADAVWLAKVAERGMCRPSLVQPPEIRRLRDLTRYRRALVQDRTREQQRIEKLLEDAQIKISAVLSELHGVSGRAMMEALIAGQRDPRALAQLAMGQRAQEDRAPRRGAARVLHRSPRHDSAHDARQQRPNQRPDRRTRRAHRGGDRPFLAPGGPPC